MKFVRQRVEDVDGVIHDRGEAPQKPANSEGWWYTLCVSAADGHIRGPDVAVTCLWCATKRAR